MHDTFRTSRSRFLVAIRLLAFHPVVWVFQMNELVFRSVYRSGFSFPFSVNTPAAVSLAYPSARVFQTNRLMHSLLSYSSVLPVIVRAVGNELVRALRTASFSRVTPHCTLRNHKHIVLIATSLNK